MCPLSLSAQQSTQQTEKQDPNTPSAFTPEERLQLRERYIEMQQQNDDADDPAARSAYIHRLSSGGQSVAPGSRLRALEVKRHMMEAEGAAFRAAYAANPEKAIANITASPSAWTPIGPASTTTPFTYPTSSGRVTALAVDQTDATGNTVWLGAAQGGVWKTTDGGTTWTPKTDGLASLAIGALAIDPNNHLQVYAGTGEGNDSSDSFYGVGLLYTLDGGASGGQLGASFFAGVQCPDTYQGCGGARISGLAIQPGVSVGTPRMVASYDLTFNATDGLAYSTDGGTTWTAATTNCPTHGYSNSIKGDNVFYSTNTLIYAAVYGCGVLKSTDGGVTYQTINGTSGTPINTTGIKRVQLAVAPSDSNYLYAGVASGNNLDGFYSSTDGGTTWIKRGPTAEGATANILTDYCTPQCWYDQIIVVSPVNRSLVFVGGGAHTATIGGSSIRAHVFRSLDGGATWTVQTGQSGVFNGEIHVDHHAASFSADGSKLYWGSDGGVYVTNNPAVATAGNNVVTWSTINNNLQITQFYTNFALHPSNLNITFGGTQDNGTQKYDGTQAIGSAWSYATCGDGAGAVVDAQTPAIVFSNCQNIQVISSSTGGGFGTFASNQTGINTSDRVAFIPPMVGDGNPSGPNMIYFGTNHLYQMASNSSTWVQMSSTDLTNGTSGKIQNIAVAPSNLNTVYTVSTDGRVFQTTNANLGATATFTEITGTGLPFKSCCGSTNSDRQINTVSVSPTDANTVLIGVAGFDKTNYGPSETGHIFKTTVGGGAVTWTNISGNLPNTPVHDLVIDPSLANTCYAGTDIGVFMTTNCNVASPTWTTLATGFPNVAVFGLKLHQASRTLRAVTHGRGVWDLSVPLASQAFLSFNSQTFTFSSQAVNTTSANQNLLVTVNNGTVNIQTAVINGPFAILSNNCIGSQTQNTGCTIGITFTPTQAGANTGSLVITSSGTGSPQTINLSGTGTLVTFGFSPTSMTFSSQNLSTTSAGQPVTVTVSGGTALGFGINTTGDFAFVPTICNGAISSGGTCTGNVTFTPTQVGIRNGTLVVTASNGTQNSINLTGTGQSGAVNITALPATLTFSSVPTITTGTQTVTYTNNSGSSVTVSNVSANLADYTVTHNCSTVANGATCTGNVKFNPAAVGARNATLSFTDSAAGSPRTVALNGTGTAITISVARPTRPHFSGGSTFTMGAGMSVEIPMTVASSLPVDAKLSVSCSGLPAGITCTVDPNQIGMQQGMAQFRVKLAMNGANRSKRLSSMQVKPGTYTVHVRVGLGSIIRSLDVPFQVQ